MLHVRDRRAQRVVDFELQGFGDVKDGVIRERRGAVEAAPRHQHAPRRAGIVAAVAQEKSIAQRRLVLAAARDARAGGSGLQRQAAPPHPVEGHSGTSPHAAIEHGECGAGSKPGVVAVGDRRLGACRSLEPRPARQWRQRKRLCGGLCSACEPSAIIARSGAFGDRNRLKAPQVVW